MSAVLSLAKILWAPTSVLNWRVSWVYPYAGSAVFLIAFGMLTSGKISNAVGQRLIQLGYSEATLGDLTRGAYLGSTFIALILPLLIPWLSALCSKFIALFIGSRTLFGEYFGFFQWGYYVSTLMSVLIKGFIFLIIPVESWGGVSLSPAILVPHEWPLLSVFLHVIDIPIVLMFAVAAVGVRTVKGSKEPLVPLWVATVYLMLQLVITLSI